MRAIARSLFFKIFVSFWIAMTLISAGFALIYVATSNESRWERWQSLHFDAFRLRVREEANKLGPSDAAVPQLIAALSKRESALRVFVVTEDDPPRADIPLAAQTWAARRSPRAMRCRSAASRWPISRRCSTRHSRGSHWWKS